MVTPDELAARRADVQIVDVRWPNEWDAGHIDGAVHVPQDELAERITDIDRDRPVVTVCREGRRSVAAAEELRAEGYDVDNLVGGLWSWSAAGHPLVDARGQPGKVVAPQPPPDDRPEAHQRLQAEFLSVLYAVQEEFGDTDPSDDEVRAFLRRRLVDEGRTPDEADEFLARMDDPA